VGLRGSWPPAYQENADGGSVLASASGRCTSLLTQMGGGEGSKTAGRSQSCVAFNGLLGRA
jgi:hypothetical protein